jgi:DNA-binding NarL/FixJ family response regulator
VAGSAIFKAEDPAQAYRDILADGDNVLHMATTVLIVDDHPSFRATARLLLEAEGYTVVGEAATAAAALKAARELAPDLVVLDVNLPDGDGFQVSAELTRDDEPPLVVIVSSRDGSDFGSLVSRSGARGFIPKADLSGDAIRELCA